MSKQKIITIIGSRETPKPALDMLRKIAAYCASHGIVVRSGKAGGADAAAALGCEDALKYNKLNATPEMYIPWPKFGNELVRNWDSVQGSNSAAETIAESIHPAWSKCSQGARKLHTRNVCQILGHDLNTPSDVVLYWCKERGGQPTGGTSTAVNLGKKHGCLTINMLHNDTWGDLLRPFLEAV